jgi:hypothetical protein
VLLLIRILQARSAVATVATSGLPVSPPVLVLQGAPPPSSRDVVLPPPTFSADWGMRGVGRRQLIGKEGIGERGEGIGEREEAAAGWGTGGGE